MKHEFCMNCGAKNVYEVNKPKFCSGCGQPFNQRVAARTVESEPEPIQGFDLNKLRQAIRVETFNQGPVTVGALLENPCAPTKKEVRPSFEQEDGKDLLEKIKKECASSKRIEVDD